MKNICDFICNKEYKALTFVPVITYKTKTAWKKMI